MAALLKFTVLFLLSAVNLSVASDVSEEGGTRRLMTDDEMDTFLNEHGLLKSTDLQMQFVSSKHHFVTVGKKRYDIRNVKPFSVLADDAQSIIDGKTSTPTSPLYKGFDQGASILLRRDETGAVNYVRIEDNGVSTTLVATEVGGENILITVKEDDFDLETLSTKTMRDKKDFKGHRPSSSTETVSTGVTFPQAKEIQAALNTAANCAKVNTIRVAMMYDHTYCKLSGGTPAKTEAKIQTIVALVSDRYKSLCLEVKLVGIAGTCNKQGDPLHQMDIARAGCGCSGCCGLLCDFRNSWNKNPLVKVRYDAAHALIGQEFRRESGTIGCAWIAALCSKNRYGVNDMSFSKLEEHQVLLVAHENGHLSGADHSSKGFIMSGSNFMFNGKEGAKGWADKSQSSIKRHVKDVGGKNTCLPVSNGDVGGTDPPTTKPPTTKPSTTKPPSSSGLFEIRSTSNRGSCMASQKVRVKNSQNLRVVSCKGNAQQKFKIANGFIERANSGGRCLEVFKKRKGFLVYFWKCNTAGGFQKWEFRKDGTIAVKGSEMCMMQSGQDVVLQPCSKGNISKWKLNEI